MLKFTQRKTQFLGGFTVLALVSICTLTKSKPLESVRTDSQNEDPILALPSEEQSFSNGHSMLLQQPEAIKYISSPNLLQYQSLPTLQHRQSVFLDQEEQQAGNKQEVYDELMMKPESQASAEHPGEPHGTHCNHKHEYASISEADSSGPVQDGSEIAKNDYPAEIIYVGQTGEPIGVSGDQQESSTKEGLANVAKMISDGSGWHATILTEVPARNMPQHVLEKLKKDYGVKVVATRDYPGANLVINCDDESSQSTAICAKSLAFTKTTTSDAPYTYAVPTNENNQPTNIANEQPTMPNEQSNYALDTTAEVPAIQNEAFGSRNLSLNEHYGTNFGTEHGHLTIESAAQPEKAEVQPDNDASFEV